MVCVWVLNNNTYAQIRVINNKGTFFQVDTSKWILSGIDIYNKNTVGNVGIGIFPNNARFVLSNGESAILPAFKLKYPFSGELSDSILTWNPSDSTVRKVNVNILLNNFLANSWKLTGNAGTNPATNFIGTTDNQRLVFRTNNTERMTILSNANIGMGTTTPTNRLHINATNPLRLQGLQTNTTDTNLLVTTSTGVIQQRGILNLLSGRAILSLNGLTNSIQTFEIGTTGTDFNILSSGTTHTFNFPNASSSNRGLLTNTDWITFNNKIGTVTATTPAAVTTVGTTATINNTGAYWNANQLQGVNISTTAPTDSQVLTYNNTSSQWEAANTAYKSAVVEIYDAAGTQNLSASFADLIFGTTSISDAGYIVGGSGSQVTITTAGTYRITYRVTANVNNNTSTGGEFRLTQNGSEVPGTLGYTYNHNSDRDKGTVTVIKILTVSANDTISVEGRKYAGGNLSLSPNGSSLIIERIK